MNIRQAQLPKGWEIKKLGEVLEKTETIDPTKKPNEEFTYLDVSSVNKETKEIENATVLLGKDAPSRARKLVRANDVIFATVRPTHSRVALITEEYDKQVCSTGYFVLRGKDFIFNQYLFYFLLTNEFNEHMEKLQKGASYPAVTDAEVKSILLHFPKSLSEQHRIVAILDEAFAAIAKAKANAQQNLQNAKELFESYLQGVFENKGEGWEEKTLGEVCEFTQGIQRDVKLQSETQGEHQVRFLRIVDFTQGNEPPRYIDNPGDKYIINDEDVSLVRYGASTGFVCRGLEGALANNLFRVIPKSLKKVSNDFLFVFLTSPVFQDVIKESMNGAAMPAISFGMIKEIPFPIISLTEQQTIVQKLDALNAETKKLETIYQQKINDLEELKKSVLQKAFSGELKTVRGEV